MARHSGLVILLSLTNPQSCLSFHIYSLYSTGGGCMGSSAKLDQTAC